MCSYTHITAVNTMYKCVFTLYLHTKYISINHVSSQVLGPLNISGPHMGHIIAKMGRGISIMRRHANVLTSNIRNYAMKALILTYLDYCPAVWSNATGKYMNKLQLILIRAAIVALRCSYRRNIILMHKDLNWLLVEDRLLYSLLIFIRNISNSKFPSVLFKHLSFSVEKYSTRHATKGNFTLPIVRTNAIKNTVVF